MIHAHEWQKWYEKIENLLISFKTQFPKKNGSIFQVWNDEMAYLAGLNTRKCVFAHDLCRITGTSKQLIEKMHNNL